MSNSSNRKQDLVSLVDKFQWPEPGQEFRKAAGATDERIVARRRIVLLANGLTLGGQLDVAAPDARIDVAIEAGFGEPDAEDSRRCVVTLLRHRLGLIRLADGVVGPAGGNTIDQDLPAVLKQDVGGPDFAAAAPGRKTAYPNGIADLDQAGRDAPRKHAGCIGRLDLPILRPPVLHHPYGQSRVGVSPADLGDFTGDLDVAVTIVQRDRRVVCARRLREQQNRRCGHRRNQNRHRTL